MKTSTHFSFDSRHEQLIMVQLKSCRAFCGDPVKFSAIQKGDQSTIQLEYVKTPEKPVEDRYIEQVEYFLLGYIAALKMMTKHVQAISTIIINENSTSNTLVETAQ